MAEQLHLVIQLVLQVRYLMTKLLHEMARRGSKYGLVTLCIGGGQGITTIVENLQ